MTATIVRPGEESRDQACQAWNLRVDQRPAMVAFPESAADIPELVAQAREARRRVAVQAEGHNAGALASLPDHFMLFGVGIAMDEEMGAAVQAHVGKLLEAIDPWRAEDVFLNFQETPTDTQIGYDADEYARPARDQAPLRPGRRLPRKPRDHALKPAVARPPGAAARQSIGVLQTSVCWGTVGAMELNTLSIGAVVIHRIPGRSDPGPTGPILSEAESPQDQRVFSFFRQRMSGVMARKGLPVQRDDAAIQEVTERAALLDAVDEILEDSSSLVPSSQAIGERLWTCQDARNPEGILVVAKGEVDDLPCVGILKLEHERGVQAEEEQNEDGQLVFRIVLHDDLVLTDRTAVFKGAIFRRRGRSGRAMVALASDLQNARDLAGFFLRDFLGCKLVDDPPEATRKYFDAAEHYFNAVVRDPEKRARYEAALLTQMNSSAQTIDADRFARETLDASEHQPFLDHLKEAGANVTAFRKDTARVQRRIRRVAYGFESGIKLIGAPDAMDEHVDIEQSRERRTKVTITDEIVQTKGTG